MEKWFNTGNEYTRTFMLYNNYVDLIMHIQIFSFCIANQNADTLMIYRRAFDKNVHQDFMRKTINLTDSPWLHELKGRKIIDQNCADDISNQLNNEEKIIVVVKHLIEAHDINKYTAFIDLWKECDPARAKIFESQIQNQIANHREDETKAYMSPGMIIMRV